MKNLYKFSEFTKESKGDKLELNGDMTEWDEEWLRNAELSYSYTHNMKPLFWFGDMVGGYSWSDTDEGFDGIAFVEDYRGKNMMSKFLNTFAKNGKIKFITANDNLKSALSKYGELSYDAIDDSTTLTISE